MGEAMNWNWNPPCFVSYVDKIEEERDADGNVLWEVGGRAQSLYGLIPHVLILLSHATDVGLRVHEFRHVRQRIWMASMFTLLAILPLLMVADPVLILAVMVPSFLVGMTVHKTLCSMWRRYRMYSEVEAYREQMQYPNKHGQNMTLDQAVQCLMWPRYDLGLTEAEARALLS